MRFAGHRRPQIDHFLGVFVDQQEVLLRMCFLLAAVLLLLLRGVDGTLTTALGAVYDLIGGPLKRQGAGDDPARVTLWRVRGPPRPEADTSEQQSRQYLACRLLLQQKSERVHCQSYGAPCL